MQARQKRNAVEALYQGREPLDSTGYTCMQMMSFVIRNNPQNIIDAATVVKRALLVVLALICFCRGGGLLVLVIVSQSQTVLSGIGDSRPKSWVSTF